MTRDTVSRIHTFQACAFNHSATPPRGLSPEAFIANASALYSDARQLQMFPRGGPINLAKTRSRPPWTGMCPTRIVVTSPLALAVVMLRLLICFMGLALLAGGSSPSSSTARALSRAAAFM